MPAPTEHQLDTTGRVRKGVITPRGDFSFRPGFTRWADLSPFVQGYTRRALEELNDRLFKSGGYTEADFFGYRHLAPETLARIIEDCAKVKTIIDSYPAHDDVERLKGRDFWNARQKSNWADRVVSFPPLSVALNNAGKVVFL